MPTGKFFGFLSPVNKNSFLHHKDGILRIFEE